MTNSVCEVIIIRWVVGCGKRVNYILTKAVKDEIIIGGGVGVGAGAGQ